MSASVMTQKHYAKAPIVEAAIDVRCVFASERTLEQLGPIQGLLAADYPSSREDQVQFKAQITSAVGFTEEHRVTGFRVLTADRSRIVGVSIDGFTFSWLAPYDRWESLRDEARRTWELYRSITSPISVSRVGVRFINRFDFPKLTEAGIELDQYFRTAPRIAPELPQGLESFFLRFQLGIDGSPRTMLTITETGVAPTSPDVVSVMLDIDVFAQGLDVTVEEAWNIIERLRDQKNHAFESCITDEARKLIL
jgi:uncharacterized protein (TIGR04255 family)